MVELGEEFSPVRKPVIPRRAIRFEEVGELTRALDIIERLVREEIEFEYEHIPASRKGLQGLIFPENSYKKLEPLLLDQEVKFTEVRAIAVSGLPVEQQRLIRRKS